ncbi:hypothetical protein [Serratia liquefaciens]|uniref:hypothetical protein n=1 Tax=Serratia liquefaciens TaxID=614 RepID=UPI00235E4C03|nr:hypothetical protein [Serratia liquefaciens]
MEFEVEQENNKLVYGIGTNDLARKKQKQIEIGLTTPEFRKDCYKAWNSRLAAQKNGKATVCTEWLTYSNFARWWLDTHIEDWCIDKDWLTGGKEYSPSNCVWIPNKINCLMCDGRKKSNSLPMGVSHNNGSYCAKCWVGGFHVNKTFKCPNQAHRQWQEWKIEEIDNVISQFSTEPRLDSRIIDRLIEVRDSIQSDYDNNM